MSIRVPAFYKGFGRKVYPGFMQLIAFISMNRRTPRRRRSKIWPSSSRRGAITLKYATLKTFYDEYFAVMDLPS